MIKNYEALQSKKMGHILCVKKVPFRKSGHIYCCTRAIEIQCILTAGMSQLSLASQDLSSYKRLCLILKAGLRQ